MQYRFDRKKNPERASLVAEAIDEFAVLKRQPYVYRDRMESSFFVRFQYLIDIARVTKLRPKEDRDKEHLKRLFDQVEQFKSVCNQKTYAGYDYSQHLNPQAGITLKPFQQIGCNFIYHAKRCILADEAGLGKSLQAILSLCRMSAEGIIKNSIMIVTSKSKQHRWKDDLLKYINFKINPELKDITIIDGAKSTNLKRYQKKSKIYILNHARFAYDHASIEPLSERIDALIVDEAAKIKDPSTKRTRNITHLMEKTPIKLCLTDAAIENSLGDLYPLCNLIDKTIFIGHKQFAKKYGKFVPFQVGKLWLRKIIGYKNFKDAKLKMAGRYLRRTAAMVKGQ